MTRPNFFILGGPKCGTTSLASWLAEHPRVFFSWAKEPHYYSTDLAYRNARTTHAYESLFRKVTREHLRVGEASVFYLFSKEAVSNIEREHDDPRYIVMLRNPVDMAQSLHEQMVFDADEHILDFETAWRMQESRRDGQATTPLCREPRLLAYGDVCKLGEQLDRLHRTVPSGRVLTLFLDDLRSDPSHAYERTLQYLGLPQDDRTQFAPKNPAKKRRWPALRRVVRRVHGVRRKLRIPRLGTGIMPWLDAVNTVERSRPGISPNFRNELTDYFEPDIRLLSRITNRDLSEWLETNWLTPSPSRTDE